MNPLVLLLRLDFNDSVDLCGEYINTKKKNALKEAMGSDLISRLLLMTIYEQRSILASFCEVYSKKTIESVLGTKVSQNEWVKIRIHRRYPGPHKPVIKLKIYRQKVSTTHLQRILAFLQTPGYLQRVAVGTKVEQVLDGNDFERLDNILRVVRLSKIAADFLWLWIKRLYMKAHFQVRK